jgi:hypothetical protein
MTPILELYDDDFLHSLLAGGSVICRLGSPLGLSAVAEWWR